MGCRGKKKIPLLAVENLWPADTKLFAFVNTGHPLFAHKLVKIRATR